MDELKLTVKHAASTLEVTVPAQCTIMELQERLEGLTGVMVRRQKLMTKGKVISGAAGTLAAAGISSGAKLMLLAAAGEVQSQGAAALAAAQRAKVEQQAQRREEATARARERGLASAAAAAAASGGAGAAFGGSMRARSEVWRKTGIAALRDLKLTAVPAEALAQPLAGQLRVLDLGGNQLHELPAGLAQLSALQRLRLSLNALGDGEATWGPLLALTSLVVLALDHNRLSAVPEGISGLTSLQKLALNGNQIEALPVSIGALASLRALSLCHNRLCAIPAELGDCQALEEADFSKNQIPEIPQSLGALQSLRLLNLDKNKIRAVPPALLTGCTSLATLTLHDNPITAEELRETPGYQEFDSRRRAKYDKQVGMKLHGEGFDEGVDIHEFEHWNP